MVTVTLENVPFAQMPVPGLLPALAPDIILHNAILPAQPAQPVFLQAHTREPTRTLCSKSDTKPSVTSPPWFSPVVPLSCQLPGSFIKQGPRAPLAPGAVPGVCWETREQDPAVPRGGEPQWKGSRQASQTPRVLGTLGTREG